ncbi:50s ribosomal protein l23 [Stylonychia lemnae]|uniref:Large ribosomal subunit protein uL23m n=1 Tax=Stylonychia lemnae TaxID=5949 RepID=A0A078B1V7_STYLE|nr:50s ribosomal protein l23 [Stylonychia lemnae]|eukprot:CDW87282.1 50s ribosomal protein l23 [Stylonychia lemnae]
MYNSRKVRYISSPEFGKIEVPKKTAQSNNIKELAKIQKEKDEWSKYMNPGGFKPTITSHFRKPQNEIDFLNHEMVLIRSPKDCGQEWASFRLSPFLSKPEIKQYLMKVYNLNVKSINTANFMGRIVRDQEKAGYFRKTDKKKAMVKLDFKVDPELQKHI